MDLADALTKMDPDAVMVTKFYWTDGSNGWKAGENSVGRI